MSNSSNTKMTIRNIELLNIIIANKIADMHICMPAKILEYDYTKQKAKVQPALNQKYNDGEVIELPAIYNVPVIHPASGGASITFPVNVNDTVLLVFSEKSLEEWLSNGEQVTPDDPRQNNLTDAIALLGLNPFSKTSPAENNEDLLLSYSGSKIRFKNKGSHLLEIESENIEIIGAKEIKLNSSTEVKIVSPTEIKIEAPEIKLNGDVKINNQLYDNHTHTGVTSGPSNTGPVT
jgi:phage baseplate assembly protein gpV